MQLMKQPSKKQIQNLIEISLSLGISKKYTEDCQDCLCPVKLAYYPYSTSQSTYTLIQKITLIWQKLIFLASKNTNFINRVYQQIKDSDPMISKMMRIKQLKNNNQDDALTFIRSDYFIDQNGDPKIIQYNIFSVSMAAHSEHYQQAKRLTDKNNQQKYVKNQPNIRLAQEIQQLYTRRGLTGIFLMLVSPTQTNIIQQRCLQIILLKKGIRVVRASLYEAGIGVQLSQTNNLLYNGQIVSIAYYRSGYTIKDYQQDEKITWRARQIIEISNAIKIPNIILDLMNQKRMQVQLSKQSIYSQYLSQEEIILFKKSLVPVWQFDHITQQQFTQLILSIDNSSKEYVLKPNLQGGGNNIYGSQALSTLKTLSIEQRKKYILMQKICTEPIPNILMFGKQYIKTQCIYQVSQYGILTIQNNSLHKSQTCGFLIRIKPENVNQGGIMAGVGSICSWIIK